MDPKEQLEQLCQKMGPTRVAEEMGYSYQSIWRYRNGQQPITPAGVKLVGFLWERELSGG